MACALAVALPGAAEALTVDLREVARAFSTGGGQYNPPGHDSYTDDADRDIYRFDATSTAGAGGDRVFTDDDGVLTITNASDECDDNECGTSDDTLLDATLDEGLGIINAEFHFGALSSSIAAFVDDDGEIEREIIRLEFSGQAAGHPGFRLSAIEFWTATTTPQQFRIEAFDADGVSTGFVDETTDQNTIDEGGRTYGEGYVPGSGTPTNFATYVVGLQGARFHIIGTQPQTGPDSGFRIASLRFTQVPLPPAFWALGAACLGFGVFARRRAGGTPAQSRAAA